MGPSCLRARRSGRRGGAVAALATALLCALPAAADHGPGTSGGGLVTQSGETLRPGAVSLSWRSDFSRYEDVSDGDLLDRLGGVAGPDGHFDALDWSLLETVSAAWGAAEDLEIGASLGYYHADALREGHLDAGVFDLHEHGDVNGMADPWLTGKFRVSRGPTGHYALLGGVKIPVGTHTLRGEGERLDPAVQPGSGAFDGMAGVAWSGWVTERITLDSSLQYTFRGRSGGVRIGNRAEAATAVAYRFSESVDAVPRWSVFLEGAVRNLERNREGSETEDHSGGTSVFASPGVRWSAGGGVSVSLAVPVPVVQRLHEDAQEIRFKASLAVTREF